MSRLNEELEQRVQERTCELRQTVEQLQNEVAERLEAEKQAASLSRLYQVLSRVNETIIRVRQPRDPVPGGLPHRRGGWRLADGLGRAH